MVLSNLSPVNDWELILGDFALPVISKGISENVLSSFTATKPTEQACVGD